MKRWIASLLALASVMGIAVIGAAPASALDTSTENQKVVNRWNALGRDSGPLGSPISYLTCDGGMSCYEEFQNGFLFTTPDLPTASVIYKYSGRTGPYWLGSGGPNSSLALGPATSDETCDYAGCYQSFRNGRIQFANSTLQTTSMSDSQPMYSEYRFQGFEHGLLGYPTSVYTSISGGFSQNFEHGVIYQSKDGGIFSVSGAVFDKWKSTGGLTGSLGWPKTDWVCTTVGGPCNQQFEKGYINGVGANPLTVLPATFTKECNSLNNNMNRYFSPVRDTTKPKRISLAIAEGYGSPYATFFSCRLENNFYVNDWSVPATVGWSGFMAPGLPSGPTSNGYSPTGSYSITEAFGLSNPGTTLPYRVLNPSSRWGGNAGSPTYNQYFEGLASGYDEDMWYFATRSQHDYAQGAVINYNRPPDSGIIQNAGFAIFLHGNRVPTAGCIAIDDGPLNQWLRNATSGDRIIMGVRKDLIYS